MSKKLPLVNSTRQQATGARQATGEFWFVADRDLGQHKHGGWPGGRPEMDHTVQRSLPPPARERRVSRPCGTAKRLEQRER